MITIETLLPAPAASKTVFFARPRLATAASLSLVGVIVMALGIFAMWRGFEQWLTAGADPLMIGLLASALVLLAFGAISIQSAIRSFELFERKLLMTISSRGRIQE